MRRPQLRRWTRSARTTVLLILSSLTLAAAPGQPDAAIEHARLVGAMPLRGELFHVQGLELDRDRIWVTSVDGLHRRGYIHAFDRATGRFLHRLELTDGARYHPGGISISGGAIWVPVAEMRPDSTTLLMEIDAQSMRIRRRIRIRDHLGFVAASPHHLIAGNWDSQSFYLFDRADPSHPRIVPNPSDTHFQDAKFVDGALIAGGYRSLWSGTIDWIDWPTLRVTRRLRAGAIGPVRPLGRGGPYTGEGMTIEGRDLYVVPEDGPSRLFRFRLDA